MKTLNTTTLFLLYLFFFSSISSVSQGTTYFENEKFTLEYFIVDGIKKDIDLTHPYDTTQDRNRPYINFLIENGILKANVEGYCNTAQVTYSSVQQTYFEDVTGSGLTLIDCGSDENIDFFNPISGNFFDTSGNQTGKVYYAISEDQKQLILWTHENHKLVFSKESLSVKKFQFESTLQIYPNPTSNILSVTNQKFPISEIIIYNIQGKQLFTTTSNFEKIKITNLKPGLYLLKVKSKNFTASRKLIIQ